MKLTAVIFDWAGTILDHGSRAPVAALQQVFSQAGVPVTIAEARLSMGIAKRDHIRAILALPRVAEAWQSTQENSYAPIPLGFPAGGWRPVLSAHPDSARELAVAVRLRNCPALE